MDGVDISAVGVAQAGAAVRSANSSLTAKLAEIDSMVQSIRGAWQSSASDEYFRRYTALHLRSEDYGLVIAEYASYLDQVAANYERIETNLEGKAQQFG